MAQLIAKLKAWDSGSNVAAGGAAAASADACGGSPIIAASAPAGMVLASQDSLVLGASSKIEMQCGGDTQLSSGRKLLMRAAQGASLLDPATLDVDDSGEIDLSKMPTVEGFTDAINQAEKFHTKILDTYYHSNSYAFYGNDFNQR